MRRAAAIALDLLGRLTVVIGGSLLVCTLAVYLGVCIAEERLREGKKKPPRTVAPEVCLSSVSAVSAIVSCTDRAKHDCPLASRIVGTVG